MTSPKSRSEQVAESMERVRAYFIDCPWASSDYDPIMPCKEHTITVGDIETLHDEVRALREVLIFADGYAKTGGYALADLYAEDAPAQGVLRRAGCHERTTQNTDSQQIQQSDDPQGER